MSYMLLRITKTTQGKLHFQLYRTSLAVGHMCVPELCYVQLELPLYPDLVLVGRPYCTMMVRAPAPRRLTEVAVCASGNFGLGA